MSSIPARMKKNQLKMKALDCSQDFSHYKSMGIFPDAQGQLTPQSLVRSGRISNSSEILWMSSLPASMKKIRSKMKALEWTQHFPHYNSMVAMETSGRIWPNFELIQALMLQPSVQVLWILFVRMAPHTTESKLNENCLLQTNFILLNTDSKHFTSVLQLHFIFPGLQFLF